MAELANFFGGGGNNNEVTAVIDEAVDIAGTVVNNTWKTALEVEVTADNYMIINLIYNSITATAYGTKSVRVTVDGVIYNDYETTTSPTNYRGTLVSSANSSAGFIICKSIKIEFKVQYAEYATQLRTYLKALVY